MKVSHNNKEKIVGNPLHPFTTPEGYFTDFKSRLMARIQEEEQRVEPSELAESTAPKGRLLYVLRPYLYFAPALAALLMVVALWNYLPSLSPKLAQEAEYNDLNALKVSDEEFEQFLLDDTSDDYLSGLFTDDDLNVISSR